MRFASDQRFASDRLVGIQLNPEFSVGGFSWTAGWLSFPLGQVVVWPSGFLAKWLFGQVVFWPSGFLAKWFFGQVVGGFYQRNPEVVVWPSGFLEAWGTKAEKHAFP